ncbi:phosphatase PAP2 family protein [Pengzhenrongella phosphoraccumulans]|uniref:phosphatase PAP2 family protein n=1 Tax=Pengzhenrongella phosphoraccumulans TaxID=3114394 RepID=UPI00388DABD4
MPATALWAVIVAVGLLLVGPLGSLPGEVGINRALETVRTPVWNTVTSVSSHVGDTQLVVVAALIVVALRRWRTKKWWFAVVPVIAISVPSAVFVTAAAVVARERPEVTQLDDAPPTSSFPSGHVGASTALYVTLAVASQWIAHPVLRAVATGLCLLVPLLVGYAQLYRGRHPLFDVVVGLANGMACAWLAGRYLPRRVVVRPWT